MTSVALAVATVACLAASAGATAAIDRALPRTVRVARPTDDRRVGSAAEAWSVRAVDPRSGKSVTAFLYLSPEPQLIVLTHGLAGVFDNSFGGTADRRARSRVSLTGPAGSASIGWQGGRIHVTVDAKGTDQPLHLQLALRDPLPGVRAGAWPLGPDEVLGRASVSWAAPVATARVTGSLAVPNARYTLNGWRGYQDHTWGRFRYDSLSGWRDWELAVAHTHAGAWVLHGLNRADYLLGPGSVDATFAGVLAHVTRRGTSFCVPRIDRYDWFLDYAATIVARCGGHAVHFRQLLPTNAGAVYEQAATLIATARTRGGGIGFMQHLP